MRPLSLILLSFGFLDAVAAQTCDCSNYPFKPNPPCYGKCVARLSESKDTDLSKVKDLDPGVSVSIKILSAKNNRSEVDFSNIKDKRQLEVVTLKSIENKTVRIDAANAKNGNR